MNEWIVEIISIAAALVLGPLWYAEMQKRMRAEADLAVEKARKPLEDLKKQLDETHLPEYIPEPIPDDMLKYVRPRGGGRGTGSEGDPNKGN